jgi:hypothetical protein
VANTVVTSSTFSKSLISEIKSILSGTVVIKLDSGESFSISTDGIQNTLTIDSVDGVAPLSNTDLCDKIAALMDY